MLFSVYQSVYYTLIYVGPEKCFRKLSKKSKSPVQPNLRTPHTKISLRNLFQVITSEAVNILNDDLVIET